MAAEEEEEGAARDSVLLRRCSWLWSRVWLCVCGAAEPACARKRAAVSAALGPEAALL